MKRIGVLGVTAPGALICIQHILDESNRRGLRQPEISVLLMPPDAVFTAQKIRDWAEVARVLEDGIKKLKGAGADFVIIPSNTPHYAWPYLQSKSVLPLLSIVDATVSECKRMKLNKIGVTGTSLTMEDGLYKKPLEESGMEHIIPDSEDRADMNKIIFDELVPTGKASEVSVQTLLAIVDRLKKKGCDGIVLGCTELPIVLNEMNVGLPTIDTTKVLAIKALDYSLKD